MQKCHSRPTCFHFEPVMSVHMFRCFYWTAKTSTAKNSHRANLRGSIPSQLGRKGGKLPSQHAENRQEMNPMNKQPWIDSCLEDRLYQFELIESHYIPVLQLGVPSNSMSSHVDVRLRQNFIYLHRPRHGSWSTKGHPRPSWYPMCLEKISCSMAKRQHLPPWLPCQDKLITFQTFHQKMVKTCRFPA